MYEYTMGAFFIHCRLSNDFIPHTTKNIYIENTSHAKL